MDPDQQLPRVVLLVAMAILFFANLSTATDFRLREVGEKLPLMSLVDTSGISTRIDKPAEGRRTVLIYFWSAFCPNCKDAQPEFEKFFAKHSGKLTVWAVNVDGERFSNAVDAHLNTDPYPFTVVYDRLEGETMVAADPLGVSKTPTIYLADESGRILARQQVRLIFDELDAAMEENLKR